MNKKQVINEVSTDVTYKDEDPENLENISFGDILFVLLLLFWIYTYFIAVFYSAFNRRFLTGGNIFIYNELNTLNLYNLSNDISSFLFPIIYLSSLFFVIVGKISKSDKEITFIFLENFVIPYLWINDDWSLSAVIKVFLFLLSIILCCCFSKIRICGKTLFVLNDNAHFNSNDSYEFVNEGRNYYRESKNNIQEVVVYSN